jgi:hypothetical protein
VADESAQELARRVSRPERITPEQIVSRGRGASVLVDAWGRLHGLDEVTIIGRDPERAGLAVLDASVSRQHAELRRTAAGWTLRDLGSTNGTFVDGKRLAGEVRLGDRQLVNVGDVGFAFVVERATLRARGPSESIRATAASRPGGLRLLGSEGGAGIAEHAGREVALGSTQLALLQLLAERQREEAGVAAELCGFVRSVELCARLPWDTAHPEDNHVKQLVRRVRRALEKLGLSDAIESRHGFGYRLTVGVDG